MKKKPNRKEKAAQGKRTKATRKSVRTNYNDNSAFSQRARILDWFKLYHSLTTEQARREMDIMSPAPRILELRKRGYDIMMYWADYPTADGQLHRMAKYVLMSRKGGEDE